MRSNCKSIFSMVYINHDDSYLILYIFSSPEPKAHGELIVYQSSRRLCVSLCVCSHFQT